MRILLFTESAEIGGAEKVVLFLADALLHRGHYTNVVTLRDGWLTDELARAGLSHERIRSDFRFDVTLPFRLARAAHKFQADVIHSHLLDSNFYASLASRLAGIPHVATDHGDVHLVKKARMRGFKLRVISLMGSSVTAVSAFTGARLIDLGVSPRRVFTIYNPHTPEMQPGPDARVRIRTELGIPHEKHWLWANAATLSPVKDHRTLLSGFRRAIQLAGDQQSLVIAGEGPERSALDGLAQSLGVADRIKFLGFRNDVPTLLAASDGFVLSSLSEAMPVSLIEAGVTDNVLISSSVGGVPELVRPGETGYLFTPGDSEGLGKVMASVIQYREESRLCAERMKQHILQRFSSEAILQEYERLYSRR